MDKCPGQDTQFWKIDDVREVKCPSCREEVEFWKDEIRRKCSRCGFEFINPRLDLACAKWCKFADKCLDGLKLEDRIVASAIEFFEDTKVIESGLRVLKFAKQLLEIQPAESMVVVASAVLSCMEATEENLRTVRKILSSVKMAPERINEVCSVITAESGQVESKLLHDAKKLAGHGHLEKDGFLTGAGRKISEAQAGA